MTHHMHLSPSPFEKIRRGSKTIELRVYDEKRRRIQVGDHIVFTNEASGETLETEVTELWVYDSFEVLYSALDLQKCGYEEEELASASPEDMEAYYSKDVQRRHGVVGIGITRL